MKVAAVQSCVQHIAYMQSIWSDRVTYHFRFRFSYTRGSLTARRVSDGRRSAGEPSMQWSIRRHPTMINVWTRRNSTTFFETQETRNDASMQHWDSACCQEMIFDNYMLHNNIIISNRINDNKHTSKCRPYPLAGYYFAGRIHSGKRNVTVWCPSVCLYVPSAYSPWLTRGPHATWPAYIWARQ